MKVVFCIAALLAVSQLTQSANLSDRLRYRRQANESVFPELFDANETTTNFAPIDIEEPTETVAPFDTMSNTDDEFTEDTTDEPMFVDDNSTAPIIIDYDGFNNVTDFTNGTDFTNTTVLPAETTTGANAATTGSLSTIVCLVGSALLTLPIM